MIKRLFSDSGYFQKVRRRAKSLNLRSELRNLRSELRLNSVLQLLVMVDDVNALVAIIKTCDDITISSPLFKNAMYSKVRAFGTNETIRAAVPENATLQTLKSVRCSEGAFGLSLLEIVEAISTNFDGISKSSEADDVAKYFFGSPNDFSLTLSVIRSSSALINPLLYRAVLDSYQSLEPTKIVRRRFIAYVLGFWHQHDSDTDSFETQLIVDSWAENTMDLREISLVSQNQAVLAQLPSQRTYTELLDENAKKSVSYKLVQANLSLDERLSSWLERTNEFFDYFGLCGLKYTRVSQFSKLEFEHQPCGLTETNETVTIAMPAFNAEETIELSIRSLLNQSYANIEVVVVDDLSTDKTADIAERMARADPRIRVLRNNVNVGPYVCRNVALRLGQGKYFTVNDADDLSHSRRIEDHLNILKNESAYAVESKLVRVSENLRYISDANGIFIRKNASSLFFDRNKLINDFGCWHSVRYAADTELLARILSNGKRVVYSQKPYMLARLASHNLSKQYGNVIRATTGPRKSYSRAFRSFHKGVAIGEPQRLKYGFTESNQFPTPASMQLSSRELKGVSKQYGILA